MKWDFIEGLAIGYILSLISIFLVIKGMLWLMSKTQEELDVIKDKISIVKTKN